MVVNTRNLGFLRGDVPTTTKITGISVFYVGIFLPPLSICLVLLRDIANVRCELQQRL